MDLNKVIKPTSSDHHALTKPLPVDPPKYDIAREVQRLQEKGVAVNEGTMFIHLIRKDGLLKSEDVSDEEQLVLAKIKSLNPSKTVKLTVTASRR